MHMLHASSSATPLQQDGAGHRSLLVVPLPLLHPGGEAEGYVSGQSGWLCAHCADSELVGPLCTVSTPLPAQHTPCTAAPLNRHLRSGVAHAAASTWRGAPRGRCWAPAAGSRGWLCWLRNEAGAWSWRSTCWRGWVAGGMAASAQRCWAVYAAVSALANLPGSIKCVQPALGSMRAASLPQQPPAHPLPPCPGGRVVCAEPGGMGLGAAQLTAAPPGRPALLPRRRCAAASLLTSMCFARVVGMLHNAGNTSTALATRVQQICRHHELPTSRSPLFNAPS